MARAFDVPRVGVLRAVADGALRPSDISERLDMAPSAVTRHAQALEDAGQVMVDCHTVVAFTPAVVDGDRYRQFISPRSQLPDQSPELRSC